jgi:hypothetical protein
MGRAIGYQLPKILLTRGVPIIPQMTLYTILFSYRHNITALNIDWPPEYDADYRLATIGRTEKQAIAGYRFTMDLTCTDRFLLPLAAGSYEQEIFDDNINRMKDFPSLNTNYNIYVFPYQDRTDIFYACNLTSLVKTPVQKDGTVKTICHDYQLSFRAKDLIATPVAPASRPWV